MKTRLVAELKADKKKAGLVVVLIVVAMFMGIRLAVKAGGKTASAASTPSASVLPGAGKKTGGSAGGALGGGPAASKTYGQRREKYIRNLDRTIVRDIFEPDAQLFPLAVKAAGANRQQAVATSHPVDKKELQEQLTRREAASLKLQSTIVGDVPTAIINDKVLRVDDWIDGFQVIKITSQSCVVRKDKVEIQLSIDQ